MLLLDVSMRNIQADAVAAESANGFLVIKSSTGQTLVTAQLPAAPFNPAASGAIELAAPVAGVAVASGVASYFELYRAGMTLILRGTVGSQAGDIVLTSTTINVTDTVSIDNLTYVVPEA